MAKYGVIRKFLPNGGTEVDHLTWYRGAEEVVYYSLLPGHQYDDAVIELDESIANASRQRIIADRLQSKARTAA